MNTLLFSKLWYLAQAFKIDKKKVDQILSKAMAFIYFGENERPIRPLNFRSKAEGGLGLIHPGVKSRAFLVKSMYKDFIDLNKDLDKVTTIHGWPNDFKFIYDSGLVNAPVRDVYNKRLEPVIRKNGSLIPSRNEKRVRGVNWGISQRNFGLLSKVAEPIKF